MTKDLIIIGGGPAGNAAAGAARAAGAASVLLVERDVLGGTCTNRGCIPTKLLLSRSEQLAAGSPDGTAPAAEWPRLQTYKRGLVQGLARAIGERCRRDGVEVVRAEGRLAGGRSVELRHADGTVEVVKGERILLAAGSAPGAVGGIVPDGTTVITSTDALELAAVPRSLVVVGSGAVGSELATIFRRFGSSVTIVEAAERLFPAEDPEVGAAYAVSWERQGVTVRTGAPVVGVETREGGAVVVLASGETIEAERVLLAAGRALLGRDLGAEAAGVRIGPCGEVVVDADHRTTAPGIYAAGDVTGRMLLAHVATAEGEAAARTALGRPEPALRYDSVPWATFTTPEVGSVGLTAERASRAGIDVVTGTARFVDNVKSRIDRRPDGFVKLVAARADGRLVGGTVVGAHASEMIHAIAVAIHARMTAADLARFVFLHPSASETIMDAAMHLNSALLSAT